MILTFLGRKNFERKSVRERKSVSEEEGGGGWEEEVSDFFPPSRSLFHERQ